jgi:tetratricopeptide (TPR) repeat protein
MMLDQYFYEADLRYAMDRLFDDSSLIKGESLSPEERLFYRAAAVAKPIATAAALVGWKVKTAQVFISNTIKHYLKQLLAKASSESHWQTVQKLSWHSLPEVLSELGYAKSSESMDEGMLLRQISSEPYDLDFQRLAREIKEMLYRIQFDNWQPVVPQLLTDDPDAQIDRILNPAIASGDEVQERAAYLEAIKVSWLLVTQDPVKYIDHVVKIAQHLCQMERHEDSVPLALEFIEHVKTPEAKGKLFFLLGIAYDKMAEETLSNHYRQQAILYYQQALTHNPKNNCLPLYNIFLLNFEFSQKLRDAPEHLLEARTTLRRFVQSARNPGSNFYRYKTLIQTDVRRIQSETGDRTLLKDLDVILGW